jgi:hypothetical protein
MRPLHAIVVVALSVSVAACGGSSSPSDAAAKQFVAAVTHDDRATGCDQVGESLLEAHGTGGLPRALLAQCTSSDLFAITGACDRAAVIFGTSVTGDSDRGGRPCRRARRSGCSAQAASGTSVRYPAGPRSTSSRACAPAPARH